MFEHFHIQEVLVMRAYVQRIVTQWSKLGDTSKLCFSAAASFAAFGTIGVVMTHLLSWQTDIDAFFWISVFYTSLGLVEQWSPSRPDGRRVIIPMHRDDALDDEASTSSERSVA